MYNVYFFEIRVKIGKYVVENGVMNVFRYFILEFGLFVCESIICNLKKVYMKSRDRIFCCRVLELLKGDRGWLLMLGKYDELV